MIMEQERKLPIYTIEGTEFFVDVSKEELREKLNPENTIGFDEMAYSKYGYHFDYNKELKNIPVSFIDGYETVHLPNMTELDPVGMGQKYGMAVEKIAGKIDIDLMTDQKLLALREQGQLPVIEIDGYPFYVDLAMDALRPKDDFTTGGIRFRDIDDYFIENVYQYRIPYNPATHSFEDLDYDNIKAIPKGIIVVEIPWQQRLDPIAYARIHGFEKEQMLRENPLQLQMKANTVSWDDTPIKQIIARNLKRELEENETKTKTDIKLQRKKGRGI
jgi:hypothetical protein